MKRVGYAQVEPNHLSAQYNGQIYAQLPAMTSGGDPIAVLQNGQFLKYNYAGGYAGTTGAGEWMLVYNEEKLYDERYQNHKDFAMKASEMTDGKIYPRLLKTNVGDIYTTNAFRSNDNTPVSVTGLSGEITMEDLSIGDYLTIDNDGWLAKAQQKPASGICFQVVPHFAQIKDNGSITPSYTTVNSQSVYNYTLADMQDAVKIQRIQ